MFERYTEQARRALFFARFETSQRGAASLLNQHGVALAAGREYIATLPASVSMPHTTVLVDERLELIKRLVDQLSRAGGESGEAMDLVARIYQAIDALKPHLQ